MSKLGIVHYISQFFANIGSEEKADYRPELREGIVGPGMAFSQAFGEETEIVATVIYGNSYFDENVEATKKTILDMISSQKPNAVIYGPAFSAGRYSVACGTVALIVKEELDLPVLAGMCGENPGTNMYKTKVYAVETRNSTAGMRNAVATVAPLTLKLTKDEKLDSPKEEGYMPNGICVNFLEDERGSQGAVEMLIKELSGKEFATKFPIPDFNRVDPNPVVKNMARAKIALVTSGDIVPEGNPDHTESSSASKYGKYDTDGIMDLTEATYETIRGGYDPIYANEDADRVLPVDVLRELEREGKIGSLHRYFYTTVGNSIPVANSKRFAAEFAQELRNNGVGMIILTPTWGTCIRCGITMVKEIERAGILIVHIATVVPISLTVGANCIVPAVAIPHPLGNPVLTMEEEREVRRHVLTKALTALETPATEQTAFE